MKVLVTGGCGFLGSHLCEFYKNKGDEVIAYDSMTKYELMKTGYNVEMARNYNTTFLRTLGVKIIKADIRNKNALFKATEDCDFIAHTAAQPAMTISIENPELDFSTNATGTFNVLEAARKFDIPMVNCSSIHVYGNKINKTLKKGKTRFIRNPPTISENYLTLQGEVTPLHASKLSAEHYVQAYTDTYGLKAATFRLSGMYGKNQFGCEEHGWVANFTIRTCVGLPIKVFGNSLQVRDILFATDAVNAFDCFYKHQVPGIYNIGGGTQNIISIGECLQKLRKITGIKQNISIEPARKGDLWYFCSDITQAKEILNWRPKVTNDEGLKILVRWAQENIKIFK